MLFLSQLVGKGVRDKKGEALGTLKDLIVQLTEQTYPPVTGLVVDTGRKTIFVPWAQVEKLEIDGAVLRSTQVDIATFHRRENEILLHQDLLDKQIVDIDGRKLVRVNDVQLAPLNGSYHLVAVDVGGAGLLRRLGLEKPVRRLGKLGRFAPPEKFIAWEDVDPVESSVQSIKLKVSHDKLAKLHPADLAQIMDQLSAPDRTAVLESLDTEQAADTLQEMHPDIQASVLKEMSSERASDILEEMAPDEAADVLSDMSEEKADELLHLMEEDEAADVRELLTYPETSAGGIMTTEYIAVPESLTAEQTINRLRELEPEAETIYYVYVVDDEEHLVGVISLRDLIVAKPKMKVADFMHHHVVKVEVHTEQQEVAKVIARYNLLAVPVVDSEDHLLGIVTVDDAIDTVLPTAWKKRLPKVFG